MVNNTGGSKFTMGVTKESNLKEGKIGAVKGKCSIFFFLSIFFSHYSIQ
jgi:hypothetical protein